MERSRSYSEAVNGADSLQGLVQAMNTSKNEVKNEEVLQLIGRRMSKGLAGRNELFYNQTAASEDNITLRGDADNCDQEAEAIYKDCYNYLTSASDENTESDDERGLELRIQPEVKVEINESPQIAVRKRPNSIVLKDTQMEEVRRSIADAIRVGIMDINSIDVIESTDTNTPSTTLPPYQLPSEISDHLSNIKRSRFRRTPQNTGYRSRRSKRVVRKSGEENVPTILNVQRRSERYFKDGVNTLINCQWRWILLLFFTSHMLVWFFFAALWYLVASGHDDLEADGDHSKPCIEGTTSFIGMFLLSVETQITIGYGNITPSENCPEAIIIMVFEVVIGTALTGALTSILFAKIIRPSKVTEGVGFSRRGVICQRDGDLCFMFRVWDMKQSHIINTGFSAYLLKTIRTLEGERLQNFICKLDVPSNVFLIWPMTICHIINEESPLFIMSPQDMMESRFEIVICLTGASRITGQTTQSRTSYLAKDILWGYRFTRCLSWSNKNNAYLIEVDKLNETETVPTPLCSAALLREVWDNVENENDENMPASPSFTNSSPPILSPLPRYKETSVTGDQTSPQGSDANSASTSSTPGWKYQKKFRL